MDITTEIYLPDASERMNMVMRRCVMRYVWVFAAIVLAAAFGGAAFDTVWFIVGLIAILIVMPMGATFVWFSYGLSPKGLAWRLPQRAVFSDAGLEVRYYPNADFPKIRCPQPLVLAWDEIRDVSLRRDGSLAIVYGPALDDVLSIPGSAWPQPGSPKTLIDHFYSRLAASPRP